MAFLIPKTQTIIAGVKARFEAALSQTIPLLDKAFVTVLSTNIGMVFTSLLKYAAERSRQNLALTATGEDLKRIGENFGVELLAGTPAEVVVSVTAPTGGTLPITAAWVGDNNGVIYYPDASYSLSAGSNSVTLVAEEVGDTGNAVADDTFTLQQPVVGVNSSATFSSLPMAGVDREDDDAYRRRILDEIRTVGGAGNSADYRRWGEETDGVARVFPYSGKPIDGSEGTSEPGDRTVYVEGTSPREPNSTLLAAVRASLTTDPDTGLSRMPLGTTDATLFVEAVSVTDFDVEVVGLSVPDGADESAIQTSVETAVEQWLEDLSPFITGLDVEVDRNDTVTDVAVAGVVWGILKANSSSASSIAVTLSGSSVGIYSLGQGELAALSGSITWSAS